MLYVSVSSRLAKKLSFSVMGFQLQYFYKLLKIYIGTFLFMIQTNAWMREGKSTVGIKSHYKLHHVIKYKQGMASYKSEDIAKSLAVQKINTQLNMLQTDY